MSEFLQTMRTSMTNSRRIRLSLATSVVALFLCAPGCSDDGFGKRHPVSGTVTYKGQPLATGSINFVPEDPAGQPASGSIVNGKYNLTTHTPDDGALPGNYKVMVSSFDMAKVQEEANKAGGVQNAMPDQTAVAQAQKSLIPEKFGSFEGSGLKATVKAGANTIDFPLAD
jgi:hypothetical protein